jgi:hypothetical protein
MVLEASATTPSEIVEALAKPPVQKLKILSNPLIPEKPRIPIMLKNLIPRAISVILRLKN